MWNPDFAEHAPMFAPLRALAQALPREAWPDCAALNALAANSAVPPVNALGLPVSFVPESLRQTDFEDKYEPRIFLRSEVQLRAQNWHDLFNALVWLAFPRAKAALNARHFEALRIQQVTGQANRGPRQDALTLFDEGGIIVPVARPELAQLLREHAWKELFWQRRTELTGGMGFHLFGHALYEKMLQPYKGVTARGVICGVTPDFFVQSLPQQLALLDAQLAALLKDSRSFVATAELAAVPVLGVPGWCTDNAREDYYDDTGYFRPKKTYRR
jgi:hypothetical protein